jgi:hypothetical protein
MLREPEAGTVPRPEIAVSFASWVCQVSVVDCPCWITSGAAANIAVGAAGGGGGDGGVAFATFLLHPVTRNAVLNTAIQANEWIRFVFILLLPIFCEWSRSVLRGMRAEIKFRAGVLADHEQGSKTQQRRVEDW